MIRRRGHGVVGAALCAALLAIPASGCRRGSPALGAIEVRVAPGSILDLDQLRWQGPVRGVTRRGIHGVVLEARSGGRIALSHPEACPITVEVPTGATREVTIAPALSVADRLQVGFGATFTLEARADCGGAGRFRWRQIGGPEIASLESSADGHSITGRTHTLAELRPGPLPWGIVPLSPATAGEYRFEVTFTGDDGAAWRAEARVTAAARASGVPSIGLDHRTLLGGSGWRLVERPPDARAELVDRGAATELTPDHVGGWHLTDGDGRKLMVRVGRYDQTPLDCGRPECHPTATGDARVTPMTKILASSLTGKFGEYDLACALGCHTVGEPGLHDGGFEQVRSAFGIGLPRRVDPDAWVELPRALRRLGGVGCTGCHGPAAIPLPGVAKTILRSDVCATCHDAPPRYGHLVAWRRSRMSRADREPATRSGRCARCHTAQGFLLWQDVEFLDWQNQKAPAPDEVYIPTGISCAACHDPHGGPTADRLVRIIEPSPLAPAPVWTRTGSGVCVPCHVPEAGATAPAASAAALLVGQGGVQIATGEPLVGETQHGEVPGCLGCHRADGSDAPKDAPLERGAGHAFAVDRTGCTSGDCHREGGSDGAAAATDLAGRAEALRAALVARGAIAVTGTTPHAADLAPAADPRLARASRDLLLVLEDPAAVYHNAAYARALLDEVERWLDRGR